MLCIAFSTLFPTLLHLTVHGFLLSNEHHFNLTVMSNKRNRRSRQGKSPSLERDTSASEAEASQGNETMIETLCNLIMLVQLGTKRQF